jgi:hypothetical protein
MTTPAACDQAEARMSQQRTSDGVARIVVAVDGSSSSKEALRWAIRQAGLTEATVEALITWHLPRVTRTGGYAWPPVGGPETTELAKLAEKVLTDAIGEVAGQEAWRLSRRWSGRATQPRHCWRPQQKRSCSSRAAAAMAASPRLASARSASTACSTRGGCAELPRQAPDGISLRLHAQPPPRRCSTPAAISRSSREVITSVRTAASGALMSASGSAHALSSRSTRTPR